MIVSGFAGICLLPALPFASATVIACVPWLRRLIAARRRLTQTIGIIGLGGLLAGLIGIFTPAFELPLMLVAGAVSGFAMFSVRGADGDDRGGGDDEPPPGDDPPGLCVDPPIDWQRFDRLRTEWEAPTRASASKSACPGSH